MDEIDEGGDRTGVRRRRGTVTEVHHVGGRGLPALDRTHRELTDDDITKIAGTYHAWRGETEEAYEDVSGYSKGVALDDIREHGHVLTPGRYVGAHEAEEDSEPFEEKMVRLTSELARQFNESGELEAKIRRNLGELGYGL